MLERFSMENTNYVNTPLGSHFKLSVECCLKSEDESKEMSQVPYSNVVGSVIYAMICIHPHILHAVSVMSQYMANPSKEH